MQKEQKFPFFQIFSSFLLTLESILCYINMRMVCHTHNDSEFDLFT